MSMEATNLHDVEDYSSEGVISSEHDQLPSVEQARATLGSGKSSSSSSFSLSSFMMSRKYYIAFAALTAAILLIVAIAVPDSSNKKGDAQGDALTIESSLNAIAINGVDDFQDPSSYQSLAKRWLMEDELVADYTYDQLQQRYGMYCLHHATTPHQWTVSDGWKRKGVPECEWYGVTCKADTDWVTRIELRDNGLGGTLPDEVSLLPQLKVFNVNGNSDLEGQMPDPICDLEAERNMDVKVDCASVTCDCCTNCN